jgi:hypothetical protein
LTPFGVEAQPDQETREHRRSPRSRGGVRAVIRSAEL